jgi:cell division protein FtsW
VVGGLTALILAEVDLGMSLLIGVTAAIIWVTIGMRWWHLALLGVVAGTLVAGVFATNEVRRNRIIAHFAPKTEEAQEAAKKGNKYQQHQSVVALGSGGVDGVGFGESRQKLFYVPEAHTDCIAAIIGEELGLRAMLFLVFCYVAFVVCAGMIAATAKDLQGFILALGAACLVGIAAIVNLGVVSGVLPNKGMALPFMSYGGSNLMANAMLTGLLISVWRNARGRIVEARLTLGGRTAPA